MSEPIVLNQRIKLPYRYTAGDMQKAFLRGLASGRLVGSTCSRCERVLLPARPFCPFCSSHAATAVELDGEGTIQASTTVHRPGGQTAWVLVTIDGADTAMLHRWVGDDAAVPGSRARVRWSDTQEAEITAIAGFEPV